MTGKTDVRCSEPKRVSPAWRTLSIVLMTVFILVGAGILVWRSLSAPKEDFPVGTFESASGTTMVEFQDDGFCRWYSAGGSWEVPCTYAVRGDLFTEMMFEWPTGVQAPATYYWTYEGDELSFELWGEDLRPHREFVYTDGPYTRVE